MPEELTATPTSVIDHERLASLINSMADGVLALDETLHVVLYNGAALNTLDINGSIAGKSITEVLRPVDKQGEYVDIAGMIRESVGATSSRDYFLEYDDKSRIALFMSIAPVHMGFGKPGSVRGYVLVLRDITQEKSLEEERDEFISVISHELRTPVTIAEGSLSNAILIAKQGNRPEAVLHALDAAHDQITFLANLLNDLSMLSRAEQGTLELEISAINMHDMLTRLIEGFERQAHDKGLELKLELDPKLEVLYSGKLYVEEILQNFITNAIKYTMEGSVSVQAAPIEQGVRVTIHDTGIGISRADQEKIFNKFFRSEDFRTRENSGTGLGLYVVTKLARMLHADVQVESELNQGSTFIITLPNLGA